MRKVPHCLEEGDPIPVSKGDFQTRLLQDIVKNLFLLIRLTKTKANKSLCVCTHRSLYSSSSFTHVVD
jgi:hypothetical protein